MNYLFFLDFYYNNFNKKINFFINHQRDSFDKIIIKTLPQKIKINLVNRIPIFDSL